jgi:hypothetical protein
MGFTLDERNVLLFIFQCFVSAEDLRQEDLMMNVYCQASFFRFAGDGTKMMCYKQNAAFLAAPVNLQPFFYGRSL